MATVETISHQLSGAEFTVHEQGANIMSWKPLVSSDDEENDEREILFVSRDSKSLPIVGGIPIQFPIVVPFGESNEMPEGGFLQHNAFRNDDEFRYDSKSDAACQYSLDFQDVHNARGKGLWAAAEPGAVAFMSDLVYNIKVHGATLNCILTVNNPQASRANTFPFQLLFHTYFKVALEQAFDPEQCYVKGLEGYIKQDKVTNSKTWEEQGSDPVVLKDDGETHYVFDPRGFAEKKDLDVLIGIGDGRTLQLTAKATIDETEVPVCCVVWNPHKVRARKMDGFNSSEWPEMIGVQPGILERQMLPPMASLTFEYTIKLLSEVKVQENTFVRTSMMPGADAAAAIAAAAAEADVEDTEE